MPATNPTGLPNGASAKSIAAHLCGLGEQRGSYPIDSGDFARCEAYLNQYPDLRADLPRMAEVNAYWAALTLHWDALRNSAPEAQTVAIMGIVAAIQKADPDHIPYGKDAHITLGPIVFQGVKTAHDDLRKAQGKPPMKPDPDFDRASNNAYAVTADELRQFIERHEQLDSEKADIAAQQKELMAEAKGRGYSTKVMRMIIALRKRKPDDIAEEQAVLDIYKAALGME